MGKATVTPSSKSKAGKNSLNNNLKITGPLIRPGSSASRSLGSDDHLHLYVAPYCVQGSLHSKNFTNDTSFVVKVVCPSRPDPSFRFKDWATAYFAAEQHSTCIDYGMFEETYCFTYVWTGSKPSLQHGHRFPKNMSGFHVSGPEYVFKNWLMQMDEMWHWRTTFSSADLEKLKAVPSVRLHLPSCLQLTLDPVQDELKCDIQISSETVDASIIFELPPPAASQLTVMELQPVSGTIGNWLIAGNTWPFKSAFDNKNIPFQYQLNDAGRNEVVRVVANVDFSDSSACSGQLLDLLSVFKESPVIIRLQHTEHKPDLFLQALRAVADLTHIKVET